MSLADIKALIKKPVTGTTTGGEPSYRAIDNVIALYKEAKSRHQNAFSPEEWNVLNDRLLQVAVQADRLVEMGEDRDQYDPEPPWTRERDRRRFQSIAELLDISPQELQQRCSDRH